MKDLNFSLWKPDFSHIYVEKDSFNYAETQKILNSFPNSSVITIGSYKEVFCRSHQSFPMQKHSMKLILAVKKDNIIYKGAEVCESFGNKFFYYTSSIMNCLYNCEYCYLHGMYPSANIVIFVNIDDTFKECEKLLREHPVYLCISYDSDLLSLEGITGFVTKWIDFASIHKNLIIELRTKSASFNLIGKKEPPDNVILAWTISPDNYIEAFEKETPSLSKRLNSAKEAMERGWKVRLCFDPLLYEKNFKEEYSRCIDNVFSVLVPEKVYDVSVGIFRESKEYLKKMRKQNPTSALLSYPFACVNGVCSYSDENKKELLDFVHKKLLTYIEKSKIYI